MFIKAIILFAMLCILIALSSGLVFLVRDEGKTKRTVKSLSWRIGLSFSLFLFLVVCYHFGWISPHGV